MKKAILFKFTSVIVVFCMLFALAACAGSSDKTQTQGNDNAATTASSAASNKETASKQEADLMAKYDPPVNITAWRFLDQNTKFSEGQSIENNIYMDAYKNQLGINLTYTWVVPITQFEQRMNVSIASGDLPDIMWVYNKQLRDLADNDMLYDLTELWDKYASPVTKNVMLQDELSFNTGKVGGKLMSLPKTGSAIDALPMLYVRMDWLNKLGLPEPKTMQDVLAIAEAFTKRDPDGNSKDDTFGMAIVKTFLTPGQESVAGLGGFFAGYSAYPKKWVKNASGQLEYGSIQPEVKLALKQLQDMYKGGLLDKEFGVKDRAKVSESITSGKVGMHYGNMSNPLNPLQACIDNDPNAEWKAFPIVSYDDKAAVPATKMPIQVYHVVNKNCKNPEAIMKIHNFYTEKSYSDKADNAYGTNKEGIQTFKYSLTGCEPAKKNLNAHLHILDAFKANDPSKLNTEEKGYYDKIVEFRNGNKKYWGFERVFGRPSTFDVMEKYVNDNTILYDAFYGAPTPTMVEKMSTLEKMEDELFTTIIMGEPIDSFDKFVEDWKNLGGNDITREVNEWAQKK